MIFKITLAAFILLNFYGIIKTVTKEHMDTNLKAIFILGHSIAILILISVNQ